ncbi:MAG: carbamoyl phosphate synthase small subunit [Bacteroidales bacterium]|nr:carbamoyl phosphate synthase small subunit [Bacteroidales bacterium]
MIRPAMKLVLETGQEFHGLRFGSGRRSVCEIVFNTSVVGYQEILSDPSYAGQIVVMTYPLIGNYGITDEDYEARTPAVGGLVVRECCDTPSNFRYTKTLEEELEEHDIPCLSGVDTRMITKIIRTSGRPMAALVEAEMPMEEALALITQTPRPEHPVSQVSCRKRWVTRTSNHRFHVVAVDCGIKYSILRRLSERGCNVTIVPYNTPARDILAFHPDGILLSNGPGSPGQVPEIRALVKEIKGCKPVLGIGLGMEVIGIEYGASLTEMGCGIHGDHPVRDLESGRIEMGVLNQSFCFESLEGTPLKPTHVTVPEGQVVGFEHLQDRIMGVQFHMEAAPGPQDHVRLFDRFISLMEE